MIKFQMHSHVFTSAKLALGLLIASTCCVSTAWSGACEAQCTGSGSSKAICLDMCYHPDRIPTDRTGGCGFLSNSTSIRRNAPGRLSPEQTLKVTQIVNSCLLVTKTDRVPPTSIHIAEAQIRPGCQNYIRFNERGSVGLGALHLGNEILQMRITIRDGRDRDENRIEFAENGKPIASYGRTDDSIENGLALLRTLF